MGHVVAGETTVECVLREIREELGVHLPIEDLVKVYRWVDVPDQMLTDIFFIRAELDESSLTLQKSEVEGVQWVPKAEMLELVGKMDYRSESYRAVVSEYIRECIEG